MSLKRIFKEESFADQLKISHPDPNIEKFFQEYLKRQDVKDKINSLWNKQMKEWMEMECYGERYE